MADDTVKCLCVHGKCNKGSSQCARCDDGWEGVLCDSKIRAENINVDNQDRSSRIHSNKQDKNRKAVVEYEDHSNSFTDESYPVDHLTDWELDLRKSKNVDRVKTIEP